VLKHDGDTKPLKCRLEAHHREDLAAGHLRGLFLRRGNVSDEGKSMEEKNAPPYFRGPVFPSCGRRSIPGQWGPLTSLRAGAVCHAIPYWEVLMACLS
jgi:hypothetical protein